MIPFAGHCLRNIAMRLPVLLLIIGGTILLSSLPSYSLFAESNATSSACTYGYDYATYCDMAGSNWQQFCSAGDDVGKRFRAVCLETCRICKVSLLRVVQSTSRSLMTDIMVGPTMDSFQDSLFIPAPDSLNVTHLRLKSKSSTTNFRPGKPSRLASAYYSHKETRLAN